MAARYVLSEYVEQAMAEATYDKLEDGTYGGVFRLARVWLLLAVPCASVRLNCSPP